MKIPELLSPEATRAQLIELVETGHVLHGTPVRDLDVLMPSETGFRHVDAVTGEIIPPESLVCGTTIVDYSVFMGAAHAPVRDVIRARELAPNAMTSSIMEIYDENEDIAGFDYYADDPSKEYVRERESAGVFGIVGWYSKEGLRYRPRNGDWVTGEKVQLLGSLAISVACLSFDYYALQKPGDNPAIQAMIDKAMDEWNERGEARI